MPKKKASKAKHGGRREGAGRKAATALRCPMCVILAEQLELAAEREKALMKQLGVKDAQIGQVIENKFETVRIVNKDLPQASGSAMPIEQLMDVEAVDDQQFIQKMSEITQ